MSRAFSSQRAPRKFTSLHVKMREGGGWVDVKLDNLSSSGMMLKCAEPPAIGSRVHIQYRGTAVEGFVVWNRGRRFGLKSDDPIDCHAFLASLASQDDRRVTPRGENHRRTAGVRFWAWQTKR